jgi:hypothetical protein
VAGAFRVSAHKGRPGVMGTCWHETTPHATTAMRSSAVEHRIVPAEGEFATVFVPPNPTATTTRERPWTFDPGANARPFPFRLPALEYTLLARVQRGRSRERRPSTNRRVRTAAARRDGPLPDEDDPEPPEQHLGRLPVRAEVVA